MIIVEKLKKLLLSKEFQKFFIVGFLAFIIDFGLLNIQVYILHFSLVLFGFVFIPNIISYIASVVFGFFVQRRWTFQTKDKQNMMQESIRFIIVCIINLVLYNSILFGVLLNLGVIIPIDKVITIGVQMISSFVLYKYFVFKPHLNE